MELLVILDTDRQLFETLSLAIVAGPEAMLKTVVNVLPQLDGIALAFGGQITWQANFWTQVCGEHPVRSKMFRPDPPPTAVNDNAAIGKSGYASVQATWPLRVIWIVAVTMPGEAVKVKLPTLVLALDARLTPVSADDAKVTPPVFSNCTVVLSHI